MTAVAVHQKTRGADHHDLEWRVAHPIEHAVERGDAIHEANLRRTGERPARIDLLHRAQAPTRALRNIGAQALRRQAHAQHLVEEDRTITMLAELESRQHVLGDRLGRHAAGCDESFDPEHRRSAAAERRAPSVLAGEQRVEEEALLVRPMSRNQQIALDRVRIEEMLRRLDDADVALTEEAERAIENCAVGDKVRIEQQNECRPPARAQRMLQAVIDIARLSVCAVDSLYIMGAKLFSEVSHPFARAVVKHPDAQIQVIDCLSADNRSLQHLVGLVKGGNENVDRRIGKLRGGYSRR
jgi:hypothetical protein